MPRLLFPCALVCCAKSQPVETVTFPPANDHAHAVASSAACAANAPEGTDADVDGDGTPDRIVKDDREITIYVRRGACFVFFTKLDVADRLAFVSVIERSRPGVRDLSIDTWLFHGDRKRTTWSWGDGSYQPGPEEEIPGPRTR